MTFPPFAASMGPKDAKIALVGEAFGEQEDLARLPFQGASGQELTRILSDAGIERKKCFLTNVFNFRPQDNNLNTLCTNKAGAGKDYPYKPISLGKYVREEYFPELARLKEELLTVKPNIVIALGRIACWALLGQAKIGTYRGAVASSVFGLKVLPTYHPAWVLRNWSSRPIVVADMIKANNESEFPEIRWPKRRILVDPTIEEVEDWALTNKDKDYCAVDIETYKRQIESIQFSTEIDFSLVIPFVDLSKERRSYWPDLGTELRAWKAVEAILQGPSTKVFQNGLFDIQYLYRMGIPPRNFDEDTMLKHHARWPELNKSLGFLGSIYANVPSWKTMRTQDEELKREA